MSGNSYSKEYRQVATYNLTRMYEAEEKRLKKEEFLSDDGMPYTYVEDLVEDLEGEHLIELEEGYYYLTELGYQFVEEQLKDENQDAPQHSKKIGSIVAVLIGGLVLLFAFNLFWKNMYGDSVASPKPTETPEK